MQDTATQFQARRRRFITLSIVLGVLLLCSSYGIYITILENSPKGIRVIYIMPFFLILGAWLYMAARVYRCPKCNALPIGAPSSRLHFDFNPSRCRSCGAVLSYYQDMR